MSDIVKLAVPTINGTRLVQTTGGVWYMDHPKLTRSVRVEGARASEAVDQLLTANGYPSADDCAGGNPEQQTEAGVICSHPDIDCHGDPLILRYKRA